MSLDIFLKIDGIDGESTDDKHAKSIEVLAWSWGASNGGGFHSGAGGATAGRVNIQDISLTKYTDASTATLFQHVCNGKHIKSALLTVRKATGDGKLGDFLKYSFTDIIVSSYSSGTSTGEGRPTENLSFAFGKVAMEYFKQDAKGALSVAGQASWDLIKNA